MTAMTMPTSVRRRDGGKIAGPQNVPSVLEIRVRQAIPNGKVATWAVHGAYVTVPTGLPGMAQSLFAAISAAWATNLGTYMSPQTSIRGVDLRDMTSFSNPIFESTGAAVPGTGTGNPMPADAAVVLTENIAARGRGAKGRIFLPGWTVAADAGNGMINQTVSDALDAFGIALAGAISAQNLTPCLAQVARQAYIGLTGTQHNARGATHVTVESYTCRDLEWDTQRRRGL